MLDDNNVMNQRDPSGALRVALEQSKQVNFVADVQSPDHDGRVITNIVIAGMGGSALAAIMLKSLLKARLGRPMDIVRTYRLPNLDAVAHSTLVIVSSHSGNTEETLAALEDARVMGCQIAVLTSGGKLLEAAKAHHIAHVVLPRGLQPRMAVIYHLRALARLFEHFGVLEHVYDEIATYEEPLRVASADWSSGVPVNNNLAKQLALLAVGKTPVFYAGDVMSPLAYKWKISWNENAKNTAFWNEYPEFNHNEFIGWSSHPVEKPFTVFDFVSTLEHSRIEQRMTLTDRLLSGQRPAAHRITLHGQTAMEQMLWGSILADFASIYVAILNNVDPTPVPLVERLKAELAKL